MTFWIMTFLTYTLLPLLIAVLGFILMKHPPKRANALIGYRTRRSRGSDEAWAFAQVYSGRLMGILGSFGVVLAVIPQLFTINSSEQIISYVGLATLVTSFSAIVIAIVLTERKLKRKFYSRTDEQSN